MSGYFEAMYSHTGSAGTASEKLLRALQGERLDDLPWHACRRSQEPNTSSVPAPRRSSLSHLTKPLTDHFSRSLRKE